MQLSAPDLKCRQLAGRVESMRVALDLSSREMADLLGLKPSAYSAVVAGRASLSAFSLYRLTETLKFDYEALENGSLDLTALSARRQGKLDNIPTQYLAAARSSRRIAFNMLTYSEKLLGTGVRESVNRHFQISDQVWHQLDKTVNIQFGSALISFLRKRGLGTDCFYWMGQHMIVTAGATSAPNPLRSLLAPASSVEQLYEVFFLEAVQALEKNYSYSIVEKGRGFMVVESCSLPDVCEELELPHLGSSDSCQIRAGTISSLPGFIGEPFSRVWETRCVHRGDDCCRFEIRYGAKRSF